MKADIAARLLHHQQRKERKNKSGAVLIPVTTEAEEILQPWYNALYKTGEKIDFGGRPYNLEQVWIRCTGNCLALVASADAGDALTPTDLNEVNTDVALCIVEQLKEYGITI